MQSGLHPSFRQRLRKTRFAVPNFRFNNCLLFDGVNDYATVAVGALAGQMPPIGRNGTISFWARPTGVSFTGWWGWGATGNQLAMTTNPSGTALSVNAVVVAVASTLVGIWNHFCVTWTDEFPNVRQRFYLNGILTNNTLVTAAWPTGATEFRVGQQIGTTARYPGRMDEFLVYDRPLDNYEIQALWGAGYGTRFVPGNGLLARWAFDETSGTTAADSSGNARTLTLINGPTFIDHFAP